LKYLLVAISIAVSSNAYAQTDTRVARPGCIGSSCEVTETNRPGAYLRRPPANSSKSSTRANSCFVDNSGKRVCRRSN
jgi:hypothetical protein